MAEAKLAPSLPQWMVDHANRYISSGGREGNVYTVTPPGYSEIARTVAAVDDNGPEVGPEIHLPAVLRRGWQELHHRRLERWSASDPNWYQNLLANPEVEVQVGTKNLKAKARTATGAERERLWETALKFWPPYADYAKKTERQIPVVLLEPVW
jgi:proline iminopeptidase